MITVKIKTEKGREVILYGDNLENVIEQMKLLFLPEKNTEKYYAGCQVCRLGANNAVMGYVCYRNDCPTRITC